MKYKTTTMFQTSRTEFSVLDFPSLRFNWLRFVSDFELRISDLAFVGLFRSAGPLSISGFRILLRSCFNGKNTGLSYSAHDKKLATTDIAANRRAIAG